ncbi:MAG TPA: hypothetical protein PLA77_04965 [Bacteroidales bacterium]|nr:hypothetical protein [Bacteroidales bacterium]
MISVATTARIASAIIGQAAISTSAIVAGSQLRHTITSSARLIAPVQAALAGYDRRSDTIGLKTLVAYAPEGSADDAAVWVITVIYTTPTGGVYMTAQYNNAKWTERNLILI